MPNVNGNPPPAGAGNPNHENFQAAKQIKEFHAKHGEILRAHRAGESVHPSHAAAYEKARGELKIPSGFDSRLVPPSINLASQMKGKANTEGKAQQHGGQPERVMNYAEINKPKHVAAERTFTYGKDGGVKQTVAPHAPDFKDAKARGEDEKPKYGAIIQKSKELMEKYSLKKSKDESLEKSPGLKQGSKLGHEIYDETANIGRKMSRTGGEATGAGIRAEQTYGGKAGHETAKDTARNQQKKDDKKNKKQPIKTEMSAELKAQYEAQANTKKSAPEQTDGRSAALEKSKQLLEKYSLNKAWKVPGEVPSLKKEIGYSDEAKKGAAEVKSKEKLKAISSTTKKPVDPKMPKWD